MAYTTNDILSSALALMGGSAPANTAGLERLCAAAAAELEARLREGVTSESIQQTFVTATGLLAMAMYADTAAAGGESSVRAGSVEVSKRSSGSVRASAAALRRQAEAMLSAYLADRGFDFRGVRG